MATVHPFRALRPPPARAAQVASVPYDVVDTAEARELAAGDPLSFLHVSRSEIDLPDGTDIHGDAVYAKAAENFRHLIETCPLETEAEASLYLYRLRMGDHVQTGVAACCSVDEYDEDTIRKHERTRRDKEDDRTRHMLTLRAQTGPVFLTYRPERRIDLLVEGEATHDAPLFDFTAPDGIAHQIWRVADPAPLARAFQDVPLLYIADGHHRAAGASRARHALRDGNPAHTGDEEYNRFLAVIFPADQVQILPYNRAVKDLNGLSAEEFLRHVGQRFRVSEWGRPVPENRGFYGMFLDGHWYSLSLRPDAAAAQPADDPVAALDVSVLQDRLLDEVLGIKDVRTDKRISFIGGSRGTAELERTVGVGAHAVAFSLYPTTIDDLLLVSDANSIMPPKSTWFEPKLRDGLLSHTI